MTSVFRIRVCRIAVLSLLRRQAHRRPDLGLGWKSERRRHHANHREWQAVHVDHAADDASISSKLPLPKAVSEERHVILARCVLLVPEGAAEHGGHTDQIREGGADPHAGRALGERTLVEVEEQRPQRGDGRVRTAGLFPCQEIRRSRFEPRKAWRPLFLEHDEPAGLAELQRRQQRGVHHTEHRGGRAHAEGQDGQRDQKNIDCG
jgi:hypothetical protein